MKTTLFNEERPFMVRTEAASAMALTLMFLKSNNRAIAAIFTLPSQEHKLIKLTPHNVILRIIGRALIMWDEIHPSFEWIYQVTSFIL